MRPRALLEIVLLSLTMIAVLVLGLESGARLWERWSPPPPVADYIWDWEKMWEDDFYTVGSGSTGWPPWEEFNGDGFRDRTHAIEKPEDTWRLVVLGDSVTMGSDVKPEEAFPQVMQARLDEEGRGVEVFNVALWGWSTRQERIAYERIARRYKPDTVLLAVCLNDIPELQNNLSRAPDLFVDLYERSALVRFVIDARGRDIKSVEELFTKKDSAKVREGFDRFFAEVRSLRADVRADGAALVLVVFPFRFQVASVAPPPSAQETIAGFCRAEGLRCLDLLPALRPMGEAAFGDYDHLSSSGSRRAAGEILKAGLLPDQPAEPQVLAQAKVGATLAALLDALHHPDRQVRAAATGALGRTGPPARAATATLVDTLKKDQAESVRAGAARALGAIGDRSVTPALFHALSDPRENVRAVAAQSLARLGTAGPESLPSLVAALGSRDPYVRGFAAWTLGEMGPAARDAIPALIEALRAEEAEGRGGAISALAKMGPLAKGAVPALVQALKSPYGPRRWNAARALGRIGPAAREGAPALIVALKDENDHVRAHAARALGRIGSAARAAIPALEGLRGDSVRAVRKESAAALRVIQGQ